MKKCLYDTAVFKFKELGFRRLVHTFEFTIYSNGTNYIIFDSRLQVYEGTLPINNLLQDAIITQCQELNWEA